MNFISKKCFIRCPNKCLNPSYNYLNFLFFLKFILTNHYINLKFCVFLRFLLSFYIILRLDLFFGSNIFLKIPKLSRLLHYLCIRLLIKYNNYDHIRSPVLAFPDKFLILHLIINRWIRQPLDLQKKERLR